MDPNAPSQPTQTPSEPQQPVAPQPVAASQQQAPVPQFPQPVAAPAPSQPYPAAPPKKSHKKLWIISGIIVVVLILLTLFALGAYATVVNKTKVNTIVTSFFAAAQAGDNLKVYNLMTDPTNESAKTFMDNAIAKVGKNCATNMSTYSQNTTNDTTTAKISATCAEGVKDWNFGLSYNPADKSWRIASLTFNGSGSSSTPSTTATTNTSTCLTEKEADSFGYVSGSLSNYTGRGYITSAATVFFKADSTTEEFPDLAIGELDTLATSFKANSAKEFSITLTPKVKEGARTTAGDKLAVQRAEYIKAELLKRGIPENRIVVAASESYGDSDAARNVVIDITGSETCTL